jgi:hypothetical protein
MKVKRKKSILVSILLLFVASIALAENQGREISVNEAMKYFCTTWINPAYYENDFRSGKIVTNDGIFGWYNKETSRSPTASGTYKIEKSWVDKYGNVWLNVLVDERSWKKYLLVKISDNGNTFEYAWDYKAYPTVDPESWPDAIMYKK